jgi:hypothetical protein
MLSISPDCPRRASLRAENEVDTLASRCGGAVTVVHGADRHGDDA